MADNFDGIDFSGKPNFMSMEQYAGAERRKQEYQASLPPAIPDAITAQMPNGQPATSFGGYDNLPPVQNYESPIKYPDNFGVTEFQNGGQATTLPPVVPPQNGMQTFTPPSGQGSVAMPSVLPSGRTAQDVQDTITGANGYTPAERDLIKGELGGAPEDVKKRIRTGTGEAQEKLAGKRIVSSLQQQGMKEEEIRAAIGADKNPNMTTSEAVSELKRLQRTKQIQTADSRTAKKSERIAGMEERDQDGNATNDAARFVDIERAISGTGSDPLGDTIESQFSKGNAKEMERLRDKVADGRARKDDFTHMEKLVKDAVIKSERNLAKRTAKEAQDEINTKRENVESLIKSREDRKIYSAEKVEQDKLMKQWQQLVKYDPESENQATIDAKAALDGFSFSFEGGQSTNQGVPTITTQAEFDALKPGTPYINRSGQPATKPVA